MKKLFKIVVIITLILSATFVLTSCEKGDGYGDFSCVLVK